MEIYFTFQKVYWTSRSLLSVWPNNRQDEQQQKNVFILQKIKMWEIWEQ